MARLLFRLPLTLFSVAGFAALCTSTVRAGANTQSTEATAVVPAQDGTASWHAGTGRTACGEHWKPGELMAAHRSLPLGSKVRVTNLKNGRTTVVRITDRGPCARERIIDLSPAAAREIGLLESGIGKVRLEVIPADT